MTFDDYWWKNCMGCLHWNNEHGECIMCMRCPYSICSDKKGDKYANKI